MSGHVITIDTSASTTSLTQAAIEYVKTLIFFLVYINTGLNVETYAASFTIVAEYLDLAPHKEFLDVLLYEFSLFCATCRKGNIVQGCKYCRKAHHTKVPIYSEIFRLLLDRCDFSECIMFNSDMARYNKREQDCADMLFEGIFGKTISTILNINSVILAEFDPSKLNSARVKFNDDCKEFAEENAERKKSKNKNRKPVSHHEPVR